MVNEFTNHIVDECFIGIEFGFEVNLLNFVDELTFKQFGSNGDALGNLRIAFLPTFCTRVLVGLVGGVVADVETFCTCVVQVFQPICVSVPNVVNHTLDCFGSECGFAASGNRDAVLDEHLIPVGTELIGSSAVTNRFSEIVNAVL